jgi:ABC-type tungstate transport system substrate-binding protein
MLARRMQWPLVATVAAFGRTVVEVGWQKVMGWTLKEFLLGQRL